MTNGDKYLKDGVDVEYLATKIIEYGVFGDTATWKQAIIEFMNKPIKPTLTKDEKAILRNICLTGTFYIERKYGTLKIHNKFDEIVDFYMYDNLFQFINDGEEYSIQELLGDE